jgi:type VI secretion system protein ImpA
MALDVEQLLAPVSEESPAGEDLAYDPGRYVIEQAFERDITINDEGVTVSGGDVDWRAIVKAIVDQSAKTKDAWLPVYLCRAGALNRDIDTVVAGAEYLAGLLERYWPTAHPQLEEFGFQGRKAPCDSLAAHGQFLIPLQQIPLLRHPRLGEFSGRDFERFRANGEAEDGYGLFRTALQDTGDEALAEIVARLDAITSAIKRADGVLMANAGGETGANFQPTYDVLSQLRRAVQSFMSGASASEGPAGESPPDQGPADGEQAPTGGRLSGRIENREDVLKAIDAIGDYYRRKEPGSPIPVLLQRARDWVNLDFISVLEDIAPNAVDEARNVLQRRRSSDDY